MASSSALINETSTISCRLELVGAEQLTYLALVLPACLRGVGDLFFGQIFLEQDEKESFHLYKILNSLTKNRAFASQFCQKEGGRAIERLFELLKTSTTHYAQQKILQVLGNLAREERARKMIAEKGAADLYSILADKKTHRSTLAETIRLLNLSLEGREQVLSEQMQHFLY